MNEQTVSKQEKGYRDQLSVNNGMPVYEDEIDLFELVQVLLRQRWVCAGLIVSCVLLALIYVIVATPLYKITCQLRPGITGYDDKGNPTRTLSPNDLKTFFGKRENWIDVLEDPEDINRLDVRTDIKRGSSVMTLYFYWPDPEKGVNIMKKELEKLGSPSSEDISKEVQFYKKQVEREISRTKQAIIHIGIERKKLNNEIEKMNSKLKINEAEIDSIKKKQNLTSEAIHTLKRQLSTVNKNTISLLNYRSQIYELKSKDILPLLVYSNVIQQNIAYLNSLQTRISDMEKQIIQYDTYLVEKEAEKNDLKITLKEIKLKLEKELPMKQEALEKQLDTLKAKLEAIRPIDIISPPISSPNPVKPKKGLILVLSLVLGLFAGVVIAFIKEFWDKNRDRLITG